MLHKFHKFSILALMKPFQDARQIHKYKTRLGMQYANYNQMGRYECFISDSYQQLPLQLNFQENCQSLIIDVMLSVMIRNYKLMGWYLPWVCTLVCWGDFNVILSDEEKDWETSSLSSRIRTSLSMWILVSLWM